MRLGIDFDGTYIKTGIFSEDGKPVVFVEKLVHKRAWTFPRNKVQIKVSQLGNRAAAYGIAFLN